MAVLCQGMHASPIHLIDEIGGMGGIYLSNIVVHESNDDVAGGGGPVLRYDATSCTTGPNATRISGSTIFIRPPNLNASSPSPPAAACGGAAGAAIATMDGVPGAGGRLFGQRDVFENLSFACCTRGYMASHPPDWQADDGCRV